jgi:hypothetical protein
MQGYWSPVAGGVSHSLEEGAEPADRRIEGDTEEEIARELATQPKPIVDPADRRLPYRPAPAQKRLENLQNLYTPTEWAHIEPEDRCLMQGVPRSHYRNGWHVVQTAGYVVFTFEWVHAFRVIRLGGTHIGSDIKLYNGDSVGRWEGNTLIVDSTSLNDQTWFDSHGSFHSDNLHVVERFTLVDADTIDYEAVIEDPAVFTQPWKIRLSVRRNKQPGFEIFEEACVEGDRNVRNMIEAGRVLKARGVKGVHNHN